VVENEMAMQLCKPTIERYALYYDVNNVGLRHIHDLHYTH